MNRILASRIAKLEARKAKTQTARRTIYQIGTRFPDRVEVIDGVCHIRPHFTQEGFAEFAKQQQASLLAKLAEYAEILGDDDDAPPPYVGTERAPVSPGHKDKRFLFIRENGREIEIDTLTGNRRYT
ncbi:hypothetical protein PANO111632_20975 [Paracoccus nototheniae]|uniref:Uncharacterized protein n=1 Tax=Paracoccus nototheniae TaxID=2489002 RepID=A0ABW4DXT8_9RHOB|nr:hypothetical protein [Paracoccus nototheniae]